MLEPSLIIRYQTDGVHCTPAAPQYAGVQGDNGRCRVEFVLHEDSSSVEYVYRVELVNGSGGLVIGDLVQPTDNTVRQILTSPFTEAGGRCTVRLVACAADEDGNEIVSGTLMSGTIYFDSRAADTLPLVKHSLSEMLIGVAKDAESAEKSADAATTAADTAVTHQATAKKQMELASVAANNARQSAEEARNYAEWANRSMQTMAPHYVSYGLSTFEEIWNAAENEQRMVFLDEYYGTNGHLVYFDEGDKAIFEYVTPEGELYYAAIQADTDEWSTYPCPYQPAEKALGFRHYTLPAKQDFFIPENCILYAAGESCSIVRTNTSIVSAAKSLSMMSVTVNGTKRVILQYIGNDGQSGSTMFTASSNVFLRNTAATASLTIFYLCKEG